MGRPREAREMDGAMREGMSVEDAKIEAVSRALRAMLPDGFADATDAAVEELIRERAALLADTSPPGSPHADPEWARPFVSLLVLAHARRLTGDMAGDANRHLVREELTPEQRAELMDAAAKNPEATNAIYERAARDIISRGPGRD